jgi:hypothetical protein
MRLSQSFYEILLDPHVLKAALWYFYLAQYTLDITLNLHIYMRKGGNENE